MKARKKYNLIRFAVCIGTPFYFIAISIIFALLRVDEIWGDMFEVGIQNSLQWCTLVLYRILIYVPFPLIMGMFVFDKKYKYRSRVTNCYNWMFLSYSIIYCVIDIFAINMIEDFSIFGTLSSFVSIFGYLLTYINKKPISFDDAGNILNKYKG